MFPFLSTIKDEYYNVLVLFIAHVTCAANFDHEPWSKLAAQVLQKVSAICSVNVFLCW